MDAETGTTIAAVATPPGRGGVGVIRLSGPQAAAVAQRLTGKPLPPPRYAAYRTFMDDQGKTLDEGLLLWFPAPHSFTGEDVIELQGHGAPVAQAAILRCLYGMGVLPAAPGEFSARAFEHQRLDLVQAEAIADLIADDSEAAVRSALRSLQGQFSGEINALLERLITLRLHVEAAIDFPEEEIDFLSDGHIERQLDMIRDHLQQLQANARQGRLLRDGGEVVIAGRPNAGKSSLLNRLAGHDRAIVTALAGTTRDVLHERIVLDGMPLTLTDTAGLRETHDQIEQIGIDRARQAFTHADLLLWLYDASTETAPLQALQTYFDAGDTRLLIVANKCDLPHAAPLLPEAIAISARTGIGIADLSAAIRQRVGFAPVEDTHLARSRHLDALKRTAAQLDEASQALLDRQGELLAESLRQAQQSLGEITGAFTADDLLGRIFGSFCIGK